MATHVYPFFKVDDSIYRPWIPVRITNLLNGEHVDMMSLLDTGADYCVFPKLVADACKIDLKVAHVGMEVMQGLAESKIEVWKHPFRLDLQSPDRKSVIWKSKEIIVGCVDHDNIPPILGFSNFMCYFKITFNYATRRIIIDDKPTI